MMALYPVNCHTPDQTYTCLNRPGSDINWICSRPMDLSIMFTGPKSTASRFIRMLTITVVEMK